jgi:hypothetical protein
LRAFDDAEWRQVALKCSVARCARVSYVTHGGKASTVEQDLELYERLVGAHPMHASPASTRRPRTGRGRTCTATSVAGSSTARPCPASALITPLHDARPIPAHIAGLKPQVDDALGGR